jgi:phage terminase large subunit
VAEYVAGCNFQAVYPDPENPGGIEELRRRNVNTREVAKGKGSVKAGIQRIRELLISRKLKINKRCVNTISEFETYSYDEEVNDRNEKEEPIKANDHALDALRYVISTYKSGGQLIEEQRRSFEKTKNKLTQTTR